MIDWSEFEELATELEKAEVFPTAMAAPEWAKLEDVLSTSLVKGDHTTVIRLRLMFGFLLARDTVTGLPAIQRLESEAIHSAECLGDLQNWADFLGAQGHNLHRRGYHEDAIGAFNRAQKLYEGIDQPFPALKSYFMTALCHRALGRQDLALSIVNHVLDTCEIDNPWRGNPLQVLAWLLQDKGQLEEAEAALRQALAYLGKAEGNEIIMAGSLADLGELVSLQKRYDEAERHFTDSLAILQRYGGQYQRQVARTKLKYAELLIKRKQPQNALQLLDEADDAIRPYGGYFDLLWRIELVRGYAFLRMGNVVGGWKKLRVAFQFRRELSLSNTELLRQILVRAFKRIGSPR